MNDKVQRAIDHENRDNEQARTTAEATTRMSKFMAAARASMADPRSEAAITLDVAVDKMMDEIGRAGVEQTELIVEPDTDAPSDHYMRLEVPEQEHVHPDCGCRLERDLDTGAVALFQCPMHAAAKDLLANLIRLRNHTVQRNRDYDATSAADAVIALALGSFNRGRCTATTHHHDGKNPVCDCEMARRATRKITSAETASYMRRDERGE